MSTVSAWRSLRTSLCPLGHSDRGDSALHCVVIRRASDLWIEANERGRPPLCGRSEGARGLDSLLAVMGKINLEEVVSQGKYLKSVCVCVFIPHTYAFR